MPDKITPPPASDDSAAIVQKQEATIAMLTKTVEALTGEKTALSTQLDALNTNLQSLTGERDVLKTELAGQTKTVTELTAKIGVGTQAIDALNGQLSDLTQFKAQAEPQLQLYELVSKTPEYQPLIGSVSAIRVESDPVKQKEVLDALATDRKNYADNLINQFRAGGGPALPPGTPPANAPDGPKNRAQALQMAYQYAGKDQARFEQYTQMAEAFDKAEQES